jgi:hypothetical protein
MAVYGSNSPAVMFFKEELPEPLPETKSQALPAHTPMVGSYMPGGKETPLPGRARPKNQPWRSWLQPQKKNTSRSKRVKRKSLSALMGR